MAEAAPTGERFQEVLIPETVGEHIRFVRQRRRLSQAELARQMKAIGYPVEQGTLSRLELWGSADPNARRPSIWHLIGMAQVLNVKLPQLGVTEDEFPELHHLRSLLNDPKLAAHIGWSGKPRPKQEELFTE
jgi:transcriptional regulator with XRE-family HTH domain